MPAYTADGKGMSSFGKTTSHRTYQLRLPSKIDWFGSLIFTTSIAISKTTKHKRFCGRGLKVIIMLIVPYYLIALAISMEDVWLH
jgi:hypothetical protein